LSKLFNLLNSDPTRKNILSKLVFCPPFKFILFFASIQKIEDSEMYEKWMSAVSASFSKL